MAELLTKIRFDYKDALDDLGKVSLGVTNLKSSAGKISVAVNDNATNTFRNIGTAAGGIKSSIASATGETNNLLQSTVKVEAGAKKVRDEYGRFIPQTKQAKDGVESIADATERASQSGSLFSKAFQFNQIHQGITALSGTVNNLSAPFIELDTATANLRTLGTEAAAMAPNLREAAVTMSKDLPFAASELQTAMFDALASGVKGGESGLKSFADTAAKLATGGGAELNAATGLLAGQLNAYGKSAEDAAKFSDIFFNTVNFGVTSIPELAGTLSNVIPTAASLSVEIENVGAALAVMTSKGVPTAQSTTKLNQLLLEIAKPGAALAPILQKAGVSLESLKRDDLPVTLGKIDAALKATGKTAISAFSSSEASAAFNVLTGDLEGFQSTFEDVRDTAGSADNAYTEMSKSIGVQTKQMISAVNAFIIEGMDSLGTSIVGAANTAGQLAPTFSALASASTFIPEGSLQKLKGQLSNVVEFAASNEITTKAAGRWGKVFDKIGAAKDKAISAGGKVIDLVSDSVVSKAADVFGKVAGGASGLVSKLVPVGKALSAALLSPIGIAIAAGIAGITYFLTQTEAGAAVFQDITDAAAAAWESIKVVAENAGDIIGAWFEDGIPGLVGAVTKTADEAGDAFADSWRESSIKELADDMEKGLAVEAEIKAKINLADALPDLQKKLEKANTEIASLEVKVSSGAATEEEIAKLDKLKTRAAETSAQIQAAAPEAITAVRSVVTSTGEILTVYDTTAAKIDEVSKKQNDLYSGDLKAKQAEYTSNLNKTLGLYEEQKTRLAEVKTAFEAAQANGDAEGAKKLAEKYADLQKQVTETGKNIRKELTDGAAAGSIEFKDVKIPDSLKTEFGSQIEGLALQAEEKLRASRIGEAVKDALSIKGKLDEQGQLEELVKGFKNAKTEAEKNSIAAAIKEKMPEAVTEINKGVDAQGNLITSLEVNTQAVLDNAEANKKRFSGDLAAKQAQYLQQIQKEAGAYKTNKAELERLNKEIAEGKKAGKDVSATEAAFKNLQKTVKSSADSVVTMAIESKKFGTDGNAAARSVAESLGITTEAAKELIIQQERATSAIGASAAQARDLAAELTAAKNASAEILNKSEGGLAQLRLDREKVAQNDAETINKIIETYGQKGADILARISSTQKNEQLARKAAALEIIKEQEKEETKARNDAEKNRIKIQRAEFATSLEGQRQRVATEIKNSLDAANLKIDTDEKAAKDRAKNEISNADQLQIRLLEIQKEYAGKRSQAIVDSKENEKNLLKQTVLDKGELKAIDLEIKAEGTKLATTLSGIDEQIAKVRGAAALRVFKEKEKESAELEKQDLENAERRLALLEKSSLAEGETLVARAEAIGAARLQLQALQNAKELEDFVTGRLAVAKAQESLEKAIADDNATAIAKAQKDLVEARLNALPEAVFAIQKRIMEAISSGNKSLLKAAQNELALSVNDPLLLAQLQEQARAAIEQVNANELAISEARLNAIEDLALRERERSILAARKTYQEELKAAGENSNAQIAALNTFLAAKQEAERKYIAESNKLIKAANDFQEAAGRSFNKVRNEQREDDLKGQIKSLDEEQQNLQNSLTLGQISQEEYLEKSNELTQKRVDFEKQLELEKFNFIRALNESLSSTFQKLHEDSLGRAQEAYNIYTNLGTAQEENAIASEKLKTEIAKAELEGRADDLKLLNEQQAKLQEQSLKTDEERTEKSSEAFQEFGISVGAQFAQLAIDGENLGRAFIKTAFSALKSLVPIFVTEIIGKSFAANPLLGAVIAAVGTAALYGALSFAESKVAGFEHGGLVRGGRQFIEVNETGKPEFVFNANTTAKNLHAFETMNRNNWSVDDYVISQRPQALEKVVKQQIRREVYSVFAPELIRLNLVSQESAKHSKEQTELLKQINRTQQKQYNAEKEERARRVREEQARGVGV